VSDHEDGYSGPARLTIGQAVFDIQVELRGHFEPIDGRYHWYGRIARSEALAVALRGLKTAGVIRTPHGSGPCEIAEPDTWDRYRITGYSTPPFPLPQPDPADLGP
jgi:Domain of unknown function (DUF4873)